MNKKGFVFLETVIILVAVTVSLTTLLATYSLISRKTETKEYYDRASDKYLLNSIYNMGTTEENSYSSLSYVSIYKNDCNDYLTIKGNNKICIFEENQCKEVFDRINLEYLYVVDDVSVALSSIDAVNKYINGAIEYMKTLPKKNGSKYLIGVFKRNENYYYASIEI